MLFGWMRVSHQPPSEQREVIYTRAEMALTLGVSRMSVYCYMAEFPDFPSALPTFKRVLRNWAAKRGIPHKPGPAPKACSTRPE
jgi:predicted DNA-binding transcriptional regulator AlpA